MTATPKRRTCVLNNCNEPQGYGTWVRVAVAGCSDDDHPVCEEHWLALRDVAFARARREQTERATQ